MEDDEFLLRVSDGAKFEDITVIAKMVWEEEVPKINVPKEIKITEGEAFFMRLQLVLKIISNYLFILCERSRVGNFKTTKQHQGTIFWEAPLGSSGSYVVDYIVRGERTSISKESITMNVKDGLSPNY